MHLAIHEDKGESCEKYIVDIHDQIVLSPLGRAIVYRHCPEEYLKVKLEITKIQNMWRNNFIRYNSEKRLRRKIGMA